MKRPQKHRSQKHRSKFSVILMLVLILAAALVYFYPDISDLVSRWQTSRELAKYNRLLEGEKADYSELWAAAEEYNLYLAQKENQFTMEPGEKDRIGELLDPTGNNMMGTIDIPAIDVHLPIWKGTEEQQLQSGAGWLFGSSLPTGGESTNCVITAHNGLVKAKLFTDLEKLELGDTFTLTVLDRVLTYEVEAINVTEPEDFSLLKIVPGEDLVTLYTCTPYGINTHRLLVTGHRIPTPAAEEAAAAAGRSLPLWFIIPAAALLALLLILLLLLLLHRLRRKNRGRAGAQPPAPERRQADHDP